MKIDMQSAAPIKRIVNPIPKPAEDESVLTSADRLRIAKMQAELAKHESTSRSATPVRQELLDSSGLTKDDMPELKVRVSNDSLGAEWVRQDFPSHHLSYDGQDIFVRPMEIVDLSKLSAAAKSSNFTMYLDALNKCISIDIRSLTPADFTFFLYWLRMNTFPTAPLTIRWTSKYGNTCEYRVQNTNLEIIEIKMTKKEYSEWLSKGICMPTVRDMELLTDDSLPDDDKWRLELAQYVVPASLKPDTYMKDKLAKLDSMGVQAFLDIQDFSSNIEHGVVERAKVRDTLFEPVAAIKYLTDTANDLEDAARKMVAGGFDRGQEIPLLTIARQAENLRSEAESMAARLEQGLPVNPEEEVIALSINAMSFFPTIR